MPSRRLIALVLAAALAAGPAAAQSQARIVHPTGAGAIVLRVSTGGGFVPVQVNLRALPGFTLYGDGTVVVPGAAIQVYPGPALLPLIRTHLSEPQVQALLRRARAAGLLARGPLDYGDMGAVGISDAPTTTVIANALGRHSERSAYALGITAGSGRLSAQQAHARAALRRFVAQLPAGLRGKPYVPHAIAVYVAPYSGAQQPGARRVRWPLTSDLATAGKLSGAGYRCITVRGAAARTLTATLRRATERSQWIARAGAARAYEIIARPLLPDERDCNALGS